MEFTGSGRPSLTGSSQPDPVRWSVPVVQSKAPAEYTEPGRAGVIGSGQPRYENKSARSVLADEVHSTESNDKRAGVDSESARSLGVSDVTLTGALTATTNHVVTFSLAFDEFLNSESESWEDNVTCQAAEYTEIKPLRERVLENSHTDSLEVLGSSQQVGLCRSGQTGLTGSVEQLRSLPSVHCRTTTSATCSRTLPSADRITGSGQTSLIRSVHPASLTSVMSKPVTSSTASSYSPPTASQSVSGHVSLTGSQKPGVTGSDQSAAATSREERIRLSRLKKEEFQRKLAANSLSTNQLSASQLSTNQLSTSSPSVDTTSAGVIAGDSQRKLCILVDSRELSGAQVNSVVNWA